MADRAVAPEPLDLAFVGEHLREQAEPAVPDEMAMVVRDDAGALLSAVLQRVQAEVRQSGRVRVPPDAEDAAFLVDVFKFGGQA